MSLMAELGEAPPGAGGGGGGGGGGGARRFGGLFQGQQPARAIMPAPMGMSRFNLSKGEP